MTALHIKDWGVRFSLSEMEKKVKVWTRVPIPIKLAGENFRTLMATPRGRDDFTVFIALVEVAANMPVRGVLADERGALTSKSLHIRTGIPTRVIESAVGRLTELGWLIQRTISGCHPDTAPDTTPDGARALKSPAQPSQPSAAQPSPAKPAGADDGPGLGKDGRSPGLAGWLGSIGIGEPMLGTVVTAANGTLGLGEAQREWERIQRDGTRVDKVGTFIGWCGRRLGTTFAKAKSQPLASKLREQTRDLDRLRKERGTARVEELKARGDE